LEEESREGNGSCVLIPEESRHKQFIKATIYQGNKAAMEKADDDNPSFGFDFTSTSLQLQLQLYSRLVHYLPMVYGRS
jgi:hypothetical protein